MTKALYQRVCTEVDVLSDLLATCVRSHCPSTKAAKRLELDVEAISQRFKTIAKGAIATAAQQAMYRRNWKRLTRRT